jgi:hypothetical protein
MCVFIGFSVKSITLSNSGTACKENVSISGENDGFNQPPYPFDARREFP